MLKKLSLSAFLIFGLFAVSALAQENPPTEKPKNDQNQNRREKGGKNGGKGGRQGNKKFNELDVNRDGFISETEWTRNEKAFKKIDMNGDGQISLEEFDLARQQKGDKGDKPKPVAGEV